MLTTIALIGIVVCVVVITYNLAADYRAHRTSN